MEILMYLIVAGIFFSAYMTVRTANEENKTEQKWIETEGNIFMERIKKEKVKRKEKEGEGIL